MMGKIQLPTPQAPTQTERLVWDKFIKFYKRTTKNVWALLATAEVAATFQSWADTNKVPASFWAQSDQQYLDALLNRYNTIGRLISGCETHKYWATFYKGDVTIVAPPGMPVEQYEADRYPGTITPEVGNLGVLWVPIVIGVALIVGCIVADQSIDYAAKSKDHEFRRSVLDADINMMRQPPNIRESWIKMKKSSSDLITRANKEHESSWFGSLLPGLSGAAGAVVVILGLLVAHRMFNK